MDPLEVLGQRRTAGSSPPSRRAAQPRTFSILGGNDHDAILAGVEALLLEAGWHKSGTSADIILVDGRAGADAPNLRPGRSHRILLLSEGDDPTSALLAGTADDVLVLGDPAALAVRLLIAARSVDGRRRAASMVARARQSSIIDPLTGLGNRRALGSELGWLLRRVRAGIPAGLLIADVDHFKTVNDRYGHLVGDRLLVNVAGAMAEVLRDDDFGCRFGGDEFVVLTRGTPEPEATAVAERLRLAVGELSVGSLSGLPARSGLGDRVTLSVGVVALPPGCRATGVDALAAADGALYEAKRSGRDQVRVGTICADATGADGGQKCSSSGGAGR